MWQFIPSTAEKYGLRTGPLKDEPVVDLLDERHDFAKSTAAAARYLRDIYTTETGLPVDPNEARKPQTADPGTEH